MSCMNNTFGEVVNYSRLKDDEKFKKAHEQYIGVFSLFDEPVIMCDADFCVIWANAAAGRDYPALSARGGIKAITEEFGHGKLTAHLKATGEFELINILMFQGISILFRPIRENGEISAVIALPKRAEENSLKKECSDSRDALQKSSVTHRSRTPDVLASGIRNALSGSFDVLDTLISRSDALGISWTTALAQKLAMRNYQALRVISNFTCYVRLQSGQMQLSPVVCNLSAWLETLSASMESQAKQAGVAMIVSPAREECYVNLDMASFEIAFYNILHNALYYTRPGNKVTVTMRMNHQNVLITVQDWGLGIPPDILEDASIYEPHFSYTHGMPAVASGLGLTLAKKIAEAHGGKIEIASELGEGTTVDMLLPTLKPADALAFEQNSISYTPPQDHFSALDIGLAGLEERPQWM